MSDRKRVIEQQTTRIRESLRLIEDTNKEDKELIYTILIEWFKNTIGTPLPNRGVEVSAGDYIINCICKYSDQCVQSYITESFCKESSDNENVLELIEKQQKLLESYKRLVTDLRDRVSHLETSLPYLRNPFEFSKPSINTYHKTIETPFTSEYNNETYSKSS